MIHAYVVRKGDVFKITTNEIDNHINTVFLPKVDWKIDNQ